MKPSAVLLIDLENFYLSREDYHEDTKGPVYDKTRFGEDLERLLGFARTMVEGVPFTVKRAYANYQAWRLYPDKSRDFYLRMIPDELMQQGVEPVQVFRLSQGRPGPGGKNAADMRMAMDATALLNGVGNVEHFVLVTGDADFIPVILELKRHGHTVSVIGVTGATNELIQRFVDNFELFEDLVEAEKFAGRCGDLVATGEGIAPVSAAIRSLLARARPLRFKTLKALLPKVLKHAFDPGAFGCETAIDFLCKFAPELGVVVRPVANDFEIDLPGGAPLPNGSRVAPKPAVRLPEKPAEKQPPKHPKQPQPKQPKQPKQPAAKSVRAEPHTTAHYAQLLAAQGTSAFVTVRVPAVPWRLIVWGCDALVPALTPPTGGPATSINLLPKLNAAAEAEIPDVARHLRFIYPVLRAGLPVPDPHGVYSLPEGTTGEQIRRRVLEYVVYVLGCRLQETLVPGEIRPEALAGVFEPGPALEQATAELAAALARPAEQPAPAPTPDPVPAPARPARNTDVFHTPDAYAEMLHAGGPEGSDTAALRVNLAPWVSIARVCADAYRVLAPAAGGGSLPEKQLLPRLAEEGKGLFLDHYDRHVRRTVNVLLAAGALVEADGQLALAPEVTSGTELRERALWFVLALLQLRFEENGVLDPIRPHVLAAALEAGPLTEAVVGEIAAKLPALYQVTEADAAAAEEAAASEPVAETVIELSAEPVPAPAPEQPAFEPGPDSGVVEVGSESEANGTGDGADPVGANGSESPAPAEVAHAPADPSWEAYEFDGALPEVTRAPAAPAADGEPHVPAARLNTEADAADFSPVVTEATVVPSSGVINVAAITREAVAAAAESKAPHGAEPAEFAPPVPETRPEPERPLFADDDLVLAVPVADWLPDGDPLGDGEAPADTVTPERLVSGPPPLPNGVAPRPVPIPPPLPGTLAPAVAKMIPPPLPVTVPAVAVQPPPLPPLPPESA